MQFTTTSNTIDKISADVVVIFSYEGKNNYTLSTTISTLPKKLQKEIHTQLELDQFLGKKGEIEFVFTHNQILASRVAIVGVGDKKNVTHITLSESVAMLTKRLNKSVNSLGVPLLDAEIVSEHQAQSMLEGVQMGAYEFRNYKKHDPAAKDLEMFIISVPQNKDIKNVSRGLANGHAYFLATKMARDLVNEQSSVATPSLLAKVAEEIAVQNPQITCKVFDRKQLEEMGAFAFLGIAQGADTPPKFIVLEYTPKVLKIKKKVNL